MTDSENLYSRADALRSPQNRRISHSVSVQTNQLSKRIFLLHTFNYRMEFRLSTFGNRYVITLFVVQIVGWVGLVATFDHSPGPVVEWVQMLPELVRLLLLPLAILSVPALVLPSVSVGCSRLEVFHRSRCLRF